MQLGLQLLQRWVGVSAYVPIGHVGRHLPLYMNLPFVHVRQ